MAVSHLNQEILNQGKPGVMRKTRPENLNIVIVLRSHLERIKTRVLRFLEVIRVDAFDFVGVGAGDADVMFNHQFGKSLAVDEDDALRQVLDVFEGAVTELARGNENALVRVLTGQGPDEVLDFRPTHGVLPTLGLHVETIQGLARPRAQTRESPSFTFTFADRRLVCRPKNLKRILQHLESSVRTRQCGFRTQITRLAGILNHQPAWLPQTLSPQFDSHSVSRGASLRMERKNLIAQHNWVSPAPASARQNIHQEILAVH